MTKKLRSFDTSQIMTCHIFVVASRVRRIAGDHRSLTIEKCSVQEKKVIGDKKSLMTGSLIKVELTALSLLCFLFHFDFHLLQK